MTVLLGLLLISTAPDGEIPSLPASEVAARVEQADARRLSQLAGYTGLRRYTLNNERFGKHAELVVRITFTPPAAKRFEVVSSAGSKVVINRILRKMVDAETEAAGVSRDTRISRANYDFADAGKETINGRRCYVLEAKPKQDTKFLFRGKIWVDSQDFAIVRIQGAPAKNPSFWIRKTEFVHTYDKFGPVWLATRNESHTDARIFGATTVTIEYFEYRVRTDMAQSESQASQQR